MRGGNRDGAGRPSEGKTERISYRLTPHEARLYKLLGGSKWLREQLRIENERLQKLAG